MESTGKYWLYIFNVPEKFCHVIIANPKYLDAIKGQKDDTDTPWIADSFKFGFGTVPSVMLVY